MRSTRRRSFEEAVSRVVFSPDGGLLAVAWDDYADMYDCGGAFGAVLRPDRTDRFVELCSGAPRPRDAGGLRWCQHRGIACALVWGRVFSADGTALVTGSICGRVWIHRTDDLVKSLRA